MKKRLRHSDLSMVDFDHSLVYSGMSVLLYIVLYTFINTSLENYRHAAMERY